MRDFLNKTAPPGSVGRARVLAFPRGRRGARAAAIALLLLSGAREAPVSAETLAEAMAAAVHHHPTLRAEQARKGAAQAGIDIARSGYYPRVTASGDVGAASGPRGLSAGTGPDLGGTGRDVGGARWGYSLGAEMPLYDGMRTRSAVAEASTGAEAASAQVLVAAQQVMLDAAIVFSDVVRDRRVEALHARSTAMLQDEVKSALQRLRGGTGTETDVAQTRARHAQAIADLITAKANTAISAAEFGRVVGHAPRNLSAASVPDPLLPKSMEAAIATADAQNPAAAGADLRAAASGYAIDRVRADGLPQVKLRGGIDGDHGFSSRSDDRDGASVAVRVSVPLFDGGETAARVEQAQQIQESLAEEARGVRDRVRAGVVAGWSRLAAGRDRLASEREAVAESRRALDGVREEIRLGQRSTLEGLDAQRDLVASEVRLAAGERDVVVAAYALLSATGQLTLERIQGQVPPKPKTGARPVAR
ncbi:MAG TPA: TolC family outer membrane protein [Solirubrobacteraceae bacterium]